MRINSFDGLRGFALILILFFHTFQPYTHGGFIGVDIFFVLSGFLITTLLIKEHNKEQSINLKYFYMRRFLRLAPALIIMVSIFYIYSQYFLPEPQKSESFTASLSSLFYIANIAQAYNWYPMGHLLPTWSLSIEEQFYFVWPILFIILFSCLKTKKHIAFSLIALIIASWINRAVMAMDPSISIDRLYFGSDTHSDGLLIGSLSAILISMYENSSSKLLTMIKAKTTHICHLALSFYAISFLLLGKEIKSLYIWYFPLLIIISAILISSLYLQKNDFKNTLFTNKQLIWLGSISYGVYLWHWLIYRIINELGITGFQTGIYGSVIAILIASVSFYFIEKPILKLKKHFY